MTTYKDRIQFIRWYNRLYSTGYPLHSIEAMGNLAFFCEKYLFQVGHSDLKASFHRLMESGQPNAIQDLCFILANGIFEQARKERIGENLLFRLQRIKEKYKQGQLDHFDVLLDEFDFPAWVLSYKRYIDAPDQKMLLLQLQDEIKNHPSLSFLLATEGQKMIQSYLSQIEVKLSEKFYYLILLELIIHEDVAQLEALLSGRNHE